MGKGNIQAIGHAAEPGDEGAEEEFLRRQHQGRHHPGEQDGDEDGNKGA